MLKQNLLQTFDSCEYPAEFLVARLLGKKGRLFRNWEPLITSSDIVESLQRSPFYPYLKKYSAAGIWRFLRNEHVWVYRRMNDQLRRDFSTYFIYHAINTLIVCCRYLSGNKGADTVLQELHNSLLHDDIQEILGCGQDFKTILNNLEIRLAQFSPHFQGLNERFESKGLTGLEVHIREGFYATISSLKQPALMQIFFHNLVDIHNCLSLAKTLRWQVEIEPVMIEGGSIPVSLFRSAFFRKDIAPVLRFLHLKDPETTTAGINKLESYLLSLLTSKLKKISYQRTVTGDILFYLWEQYRYTRNISMVLHTVMVDDEPVRQSIVA